MNAQELRPPVEPGRLVKWASHDGVMHVQGRLLRADTDNNEWRMLVLHGDEKHIVSSATGTVQDAGWKLQRNRPMGLTYLVEPNGDEWAIRDFQSLNDICDAIANREPAISSYSTEIQNTFWKTRTADEYKNAVVGNLSQKYGIGIDDITTEKRIAMEHKAGNNPALFVEALATKYDLDPIQQADSWHYIGLKHYEPKIQGVEADPYAKTAPGMR